MKGNGCTDIKKFANWVDKGKELKAEILAKVDSGLRTNSAQYASLRGLCESHARWWSEFWRPGRRPSSWSCCNDA